jgi:predicted enzyme related to lactoylglutathione lyase
LLGRAAALLTAGALAPLARGARAAEPNAAPAAPPQPLAHFGFTKLVVADLERSAAFYAAVFGLVETGRVEAAIAGRKISEILFAPSAPGGATFVLLTYVGTENPAADEAILGFQTSDIDALVARAQAVGGSLHEAPRTVSEMRIRVAFVKDVEGHLIEVVQPLA